MDEAKAFQATLLTLPPDAPTACRGWLVRDVVAHLAAGAREEAELIEAELRGEPTRPTRPFDEREAAYRELPYPQLLTALTRQSRRLGLAVDALTAAGRDVEFTGARLSGPDLRRHGRSELALHRWDLAGDDPVSARLLGQADLTAHAVRVLSEMTSLRESLAARVARLVDPPARFGFVLRSPERDDVVVQVGPTPRWQLRPRDDSAGPGAADPVAADAGAADAGAAVPVVRCSAADRLLLLWGRPVPGDRVDFGGAPDDVASLVTAVLRV